MTLPQQPSPPRAAQLISQLLDRGYEQSTRAVLAAIDRNSTSGIVAQRMAELDAEAARLAAQGERLTPDNPVLRALTADMEPVLRRDAALIDAAADDVQASGTNAAARITRELAYPGIGDAQLRSIGGVWNRPDPEAIRAVVGYTSSPAFAASLAQFPAGTLDTIQNIAVRGLVAGQGPRTTAREIRRTVQGLPAYQANNMMRTMQLESYRSASTAHHVANANLIDYLLRVETLDARTCMMCISLHGTTLRVGEKLEEHHQGRGVAVPVVRGRQLNVETGIAWFERQPENRQRQQMGEAAHEAWKGGRFQLSDYPQPYRDPVYGAMFREASLKGLIGEDARQYYQRAG